MSDENDNRAPTSEPTEDQQEPPRPLHLAWTGTEWVDSRCGCRYHPDDNNMSHGGAPHVHLCERHASVAAAVLGERERALVQEHLDDNATGLADLARVPPQSEPAEPRRCTCAACGRGAPASEPLAEALAEWPTRMRSRAARMRGLLAASTHDDTPTPPTDDDDAAPASEPTDDKDTPAPWWAVAEMARLRNRIAELVHTAPTSEPTEDRTKPPPGWYTWDTEGDEPLFVRDEHMSTMCGDSAAWTLAEAWAQYGSEGLLRDRITAPLRAALTQATQETERLYEALVTERTFTRPGTACYERITKALNAAPAPESPTPKEE